MPWRAQQFAQQSAAGAVHGIDDEAEFGGAQAVPIHQFVERFEIGRAHVERMNQIRGAAAAAERLRAALSQVRLPFARRWRAKRELP